MKKIKELLVKYREIIVYLIFGVLTTLVGWGTYIVFANKCGMSVFVSNLLSWICAVVFAYITNKIWVFESKSWALNVLAKEIVSFVASRGITGVLEIVVVPIIATTGFDNIFYHLATKMGIPNGIFYTKGVYSKVVVAVVVVILNYVFSKLLVFKNKDKKENNDEEAEQA